MAKFIPVNVALGIRVMPSHSTQYCTFRVAKRLLGVEVQHVQEVIRSQAMTRVPLAGRAVGGLINLRGQIVTAIDLRERLGLPPRESNQEPMNVVVRDEDDVVSLLVDEIGDVMEVDGDLFESPPSTASFEARRMIEGAFKLSSELLLVLNIKQALADAGPRPAGEPACVN
jgi:purine-binding chemotaxis protein CheW